MRLRKRSPREVATPDGLRDCRLAADNSEFSPALLDRQAAIWLAALTGVPVSRDY